MNGVKMEFKKTLLVAGLSALFTLGLVGCSDDSSGDLTSDSGKGVSVPAASQPSAADVKQPAPTALKEATDDAVEKVKDTAAEVTEKVKETATEAKEVIKEKAEKVVAAVTPSTKSGSEIYGSCIGCHGAAGEGGVGPQLAGQSQADAVAKLHKYKSGEQVGPMTAMMAPMAQGLSDAEIEAVAEYTAGL